MVDPDRDNSQSGSGAFAHIGRSRGGSMSARKPSFGRGTGVGGVS